MLFEDKKLDAERIVDLLLCPIHTVKPFSLMLAPTYVFMKLNQKLVSVKAPLDFFTPEELKKLVRYETFYLPRFAKASARFQTAARLVRSIMTAGERTGFTPTPYELSHEINSALCGLWGKDERVEPFFMAIFADELCVPMDSETLLRSRESAVELHDFGLILSGTFVFLSLQVKAFSYTEISILRTQIYARTVSGYKWDQPTSEDEAMLKSLFTLIAEQPSINREMLFKIREEWAQRLCARLDRFSHVLQRKTEPSPSIFGPEGFAG